MSKSKDVKAEQLKSVYGDMTVEEKKAFYKDWAESYDSDTLDDFGWIGYKSSAAEFAKRVLDKSAHILDAGCGTGLSGVGLKDEGFTNVEGADFSPEMLAQAEAAGVYNNLFELDLTKPPEIKTKYDAVFSVGVFGFGPPFIPDLVNLISLAKPGAPVILTVNGKGWGDKNWDEELPKVIDEHSLTLEEQFEISYLEKEQINGVLLVFRA